MPRITFTALKVQSIKAPAAKPDGAVATIDYVAAIGLAAKGVVTGGGPSDPKENAVWRLTGRQPYSVRIGDTWYGYHRLGALGMVLGVAADAFDIGHKMSTDDTANVATLITSAVSKNVLA
jgi:hypothetical protein